MTIYKKKSPFLAAGILLCAVSVVCITLLVYSIITALAEKSRLESIGADVDLKFTWLFFVDIAAIIISSIIGFNFICKSKASHKISADVLNKDKVDNGVPNMPNNSAPETNRPIPAVSYTDRLSRGVKTGGGLHINLESSESTAATQSSKEIKSEDKSDTSGGGYFSSGGDL